MRPPQSGRALARGASALESVGEKDGSVKRVHWRLPELQARRCGVVGDELVESTDGAAGAATHIFDKDYVAVDLVGPARTVAP